MERSPLLTEVFPIGRVEVPEPPAWQSVERCFDFGIGSIPTSRFEPGHTRRSSDKGRLGARSLGFVRMLRPDTLLAVLEELERLGVPPGTDTELCALFSSGRFARLPPHMPVAAPGSETVLKPFPGVRDVPGRACVATSWKWFAVANGYQDLHIESLDAVMKQDQGILVLTE